MSSSPSPQEIRSACDKLHNLPDYDYKSYRLSSNWYHDPLWKKLRYVYGESVLDSVGGGDGGITHDMALCVTKASSYQK